jgi:hypothetical protein
VSEIKKKRKKQQQQAKYSSKTEARLRKLIAKRGAQALGCQLAMAELRGRVLGLERDVDNLVRHAVTGAFPPGVCYEAVPERGPIAPAESMTVQQHVDRLEGMLARQSASATAEVES